MEVKNRLTGAGFGILGDSYSTFQGHIPEGNRCYYPRADADDGVKSVEKTWWHRLMTRNDMKLLINDSFSGATVCADIPEGLAPISPYTERVKRTFSGDIKPEYIFLFGGTNDSWQDRTVGQVQYSDWTDEDLKQILPAFCYVMDYLIQHNPQATIVVPINTGIKPVIIEGIVEAAEHYGAVAICLADIDKKKGHPSALGMEQIADQIQAALA